MKKTTVFLLLFVLSGLLVAQTSVLDLRCENLSEPLGIDAATPRFSWRVEADRRNVVQTAYEIRVGTDKMALGKNKKLVWSSGKIGNNQSVYVPYAGAALQAGAAYFWQVRIWDETGIATEWSKPASFRMGLLQPADWKAQWISPGYVEDSINRPSPLLRKTFKTGKKIASATAFITAHGMYEAWINGKRVGDACLTPGWTSYNKRLQYQTYDVTNLLQQGMNTTGAVLGSGWYRGYLAWGDNHNIYGRELALLFQLEITYTDGSRETIVSDGSWKSATGSIVSSEIYHGETIDARLEKDGWSLAAYNDASWTPVKIKNVAAQPLVSTWNEPVRAQETFKAVKMITTPKGEKVIDFGQNLVGWVRVKLRGKAGDKITLSHAEVLDKEGNFYTDNLRAARAKAVYILRGSGEENFEPHFTFYGFRYIRVEDWTGEINPDNFTAVALYSDMAPSGEFSCSNALINQLQHNIEWGQRGNFLDVPTDCPQRDERLGWTGDAQVFARTAAFNMNVHNFFAKWLRDVEADQFDNGSVPFVVPNVLGPTAGGSTGWADVANIIPWNMYLAYGDRHILERQYNSMKRWVGYMENNSNNYLWNKGFHFGDWLYYNPGDDPGGAAAVTDKYLIAQCFFAYSTQLVINAAQVLGNKEDEARYTTLLQHIKDAFQQEYVTPNGRLLSSTQTAYVLALHFDMLPESVRAANAQRLVDNIRAYDKHLTTGFLGTPYLCHVLTRFGHTDVAYQLLLQETYPSWLYPVKMGATTIWERWDGIKPDGTFQTPGMNSYNHYAYGAIGDWMYRVVAGITESGPGYREIRIQPHIGGNLSHAAASLKTYYGAVRSQWKTEANGLTFEVEIPCNTQATVYIPGDADNKITEGGQPLVKIPGLKVKGLEAGYVVVELGSGKYSFKVEK